MDREIKYLKWLRTLRFKNHRQRIKAKYCIGFKGQCKGLIKRNRMNRVTHKERVEAFASNEYYK